jgi:hypothetical protein
VSVRKIPKKKFKIESDLFFYVKKYNLLEPGPLF